MKRGNKNITKNYITQNIRIMNKYNNNSNNKIRIMSRVSETKTQVWIGESVYWIFTSRNNN
jgi:hypothetical protein